MPLGFSIGTVAPWDEGSSDAPTLEVDPNWWFQLSLIVLCDSAPSGLSFVLRHWAWDVIPQSRSLWFFRTQWCMKQICRPWPNRLKLKILYWHFSYWSQYTLVHLWIYWFVHLLAGSQRIDISFVIIRGKNERQTYANVQESPLRECNIPSEEEVAVNTKVGVCVTFAAE